MTERRRTTLKATEKTRSHTATTWRHRPAPSTTAATRLTTTRTHLWVRTAPSDNCNPAGKTNLAPSSDLNAHRVRIHPRTLDNHCVFSPSSSPVVQPDFTVHSWQMHGSCNSVTVDRKAKWALITAEPFLLSCMLGLWLTTIFNIDCAARYFHNSSLVKMSKSCKKCSDHNFNQLSERQRHFIYYHKWQKSRTLYTSAWKMTETNTRLSTYWCRGCTWCNSSTLNATGSVNRI